MARHPVKSEPEPMWSLKQRQGNALHRVCAFQGSFPPQLPAHFLDMFPDAKVVLDPFCGRGTTILESVLRGKVTFGADLLPVSRLLSRVKLACPSADDVAAEVDELVLSHETGPAPEHVEPFFHPATFSQLECLRRSPRSNALSALALGRLHGHSSGFFSTTTFNVISIGAESLRRLMKKHGTSAELRDVKSLLLKAARKFMPEKPIRGDGEILAADARRLPLPDGCVDLVITSPPFFDVIDYENVNWLREWFLGDRCGGSRPFVTGKRADYQNFLGDVLRELRRVVSTKARVVFEVGPVKKQGSMWELVRDQCTSLFDVERVITNSFAEHGGGSSVPKISRAMHCGQETTTMANQCVILRPA